MLLIHPVNHFIVAEVNKDRVKIYNKYLLEALRINGICIPKKFQEVFKDKKMVYPGDALFPKAFVEIYYPFCLREAGFKFSKH